ncbi:MAG: hypothetical protein ABIN57_08230 [Chitinophagaceae bacterium]
MDHNNPPNEKNSEKGQHNNPLPNEISNEEKKKAERAHAAADKDIDNDPDLNHNNPSDDLDEGELARLEGDNKDLV